MRGRCFICSNFQNLKNSYLKIRITIFKYQDYFGKGFLGITHVQILANERSQQVFSQIRARSDPILLHSGKARKNNRF